MTVPIIQPILLYVAWRSSHPTCCDPLLALTHVHTGVTDLPTLLDTDHLGHTTRILEKPDTSIIFDEDALARGAPVRVKHVFVRLLVVRAQKVLERLGGVPGVVVRDLGADVVRDVRLGDTVEGDGAKGAEEVAVHGGEGAAGESPLVGRVVGYASVQAGSVISP